MYFFHKNVKSNLGNKKNIYWLRNHINFVKVKHTVEM